MKHPFKPKNYKGDCLTTLAREIADMRYDKIVFLLRTLSVCIAVDSGKDDEAGRKKLSKLLDKFSEDIDLSADRMEEIWKLCEPYMTKVNSKTHIECPHCGFIQTHEQAGTYEKWFPMCVNCDECTELDPNEVEDEVD